jgi:hypothetical protein
MADQVLGVNLVHSADNPAAIQEAYDKLRAEKYPAPDWVQQGPNFVQSQLTGQVVNLNQEAIALLQAGPTRNDAVALVQKDDGSQQSIFIPQSAVAAVGGNMQTLSQNLQQSLNQAAAQAGKGINPVILLAGGGVLLYLVLRRG